MKIEGLRSEKKGDRARVAATVTWENCDRPTQEVYFETAEAFAEGLSCNPHAFLVSCAIPAMHYGEERIFIDAEICPELRDGLVTAMSWLRHWFGSDRELVRIEAKTRSSMPIPRTPERAGFFFSGGIDSFATLRTNRLNFPLDHPWSIKDGLLVYGLELDEPEAFAYVMDSLSGVAQEIGITFIPVYTNVYLNYRQEDAADGFSFWTNEFQGAVFAAIAHAFARRITVVSVAASDSIPALALLNKQNLKPLGSHPLLDPNYGSSDVRIRHDGIALSRFAKTKLIAEWNIALQNLRVCNQYKLYRPGRLNCGHCEKCVRTMLALLAVERLDQSCTFPKRDVSEELLATVNIKPGVNDDYLELLAPLAEKGRLDLVRAIEGKIAEYRRRQRITNWKERVKRFDHKYLNGNLVKIERLIF